MTKEKNSMFSFLWIRYTVIINKGTPERVVCMERRKIWKENSVRSKIGSSDNILQCWKLW